MTEKLQQLLDLHHDKNIKRELNKEEKALYATELSELLSKNDLSPEAIRYVLALPFQGGVEGFCMWRKTLGAEEIGRVYDTLLDSKPFESMKSGQKVKVVLLLLADQIAETEHNKEVIRRLLWQFVNVSYTKNGERVHDLSVSFRNYFLKKIEQTTQMPNLEELQFNEDYKKEILTLFKTALSDAKVSGKKEEENKIVLMKWISDSDIPLVENPSEDKLDIEEVEIKQAVKKEKKTKRGETKSLGRLATSLRDISGAVNILEETVQQQSDELDKNKKTIVALKKNSEIDQSRIESLEKENTELKDSLELCRQDLENTKSEKQALEERVSRQASVLNVYTEDKEKSQTEQLNSIAASLVKYYKDFELAKSMELTTDIEMTLLDLLEDIFKRLEKNGIDIKGRI